MIEDFILNNAQGFVGMIILGYILKIVLVNIENKMVQQIDALLLVSDRQDKMRQEIEEIKKELDKVYRSE